jgi:hypothetical protein
MGLEPTTFCMATRSPAERLRRNRMVDPFLFRQRQVMPTESGCFGTHFGTHFDCRTE